jgi:hypothetical protein
MLFSPTNFFPFFFFFPTFSPFFFRHMHLRRLANTLLTYGEALVGHGQLEAGLERLWQAERLRRERCGLHHPDMAEVWDSIGCALPVEQGLPLLLQAETLRIDTLGADHPRTASLQLTIAQQLASLGRTEEARHKCRAALAHLPAAPAKKRLEAEQLLARLTA